jgi:hypothetical protein
MIKEDLICKDFKNEVWRYIEKDLPKERVIFWDKHIELCPSCSAFMQSELNMLTTCAETLSEDILDSRFDAMINTAVNTRKRFSVKNIFAKGEELSFRTKVALISSFAVVAVVISLISPKQSPVKDVSNELLDWEGAKINSQLETIEQKIETISNDKWSNEIRSIDEQLQKLEVRVDKF